MRCAQSDGYTLVVCEKPDAARRVSEALSGGTAKRASLRGVTYFTFRHASEEFVVCSAQGHVFGVSDPFDERTVYPVYDVEWYRSDLFEKGKSGGERIDVIRKLSEGAKTFVNACDYDVEGETIGFNILRYACGGKEKGALRAKFSTLTREELVEAFRTAEPDAAQGLARAGRTRHVIDFVWGVNLSRALSQAALLSGHRYRTVSIGRVQGPTLSFLVEREREIRAFVPVPFWKVEGAFEKEGMRFVAGYSEEKVKTREEAQRVHDECAGKDGTVESMKRSVVHVPPYPPFNVGDLQKEAFRCFGFSPSRTLQVAERLYLSALISYPRTDSQKLPPSLGLGKIVRDLARQASYSKEADEILRGSMRPAQGPKTDSAHPAIHPTGEAPRRPLEQSEAKLYDLVVRRFLSTFAPPARREITSAMIRVQGHAFRLAGGRTLFPGWMKYYWRYRAAKDVDVPRLEEGDRVTTVDVRVGEKFTEKPARYTQGSLLERMERERIGTKATRAEVISTLLTRGYATGEFLEVTDLGLSVMEILEKHAPSIVTTALTRAIEERLEAIEEGSDDGRGLFRETVDAISKQLLALGADEGSVGGEIGEAVAKTTAAAYLLGSCPVCKTGNLRMITSRKTKKRFVGCTNYSNGCRASAPLPQRGRIRKAAKPCAACSWPVIYVLKGRRPWRLCVNPRCPTKGGVRDEMPAV